MVALDKVAAKLDEIDMPRTRGMVGNNTPREGAVQVHNFLNSAEGGFAWRDNKLVCGRLSIDTETQFSILDRLGPVILENLVNFKMLKKRQQSTFGVEQGAQRRTNHVGPLEQRKNFNKI